MKPDVLGMNKYKFLIATRRLNFFGMRGGIGLTANSMNLITMQKQYTVREGGMDISIMTFAVFKK